MSPHIEDLLKRIQLGDPLAETEFFDAVYPELRAMAYRHFGTERSDHTLQPTILVHEAYLKLMSGLRDFESGPYFFGAADRAMDQVLIDYSRRKNAQKRCHVKAELTEAADRAAIRDYDRFALDELLQVLNRINPIWCKVVQTRWLEGLTAREAAVALGMGESTARRALADSRQWLRHVLEPDGCISEVGRVLGQYQIEKKIADGSTSTVYKARDMRLQKPVALKVVTAAQCIDVRRRLSREARCASALNHPHIVDVYDIAITPAADILVMEYVSGRTLRQVIPRSGMPIQSALTYAEQITSALAAAHCAGIVHRDIKPSNVLIAAAGVKVVDFGLAKQIFPSATADESGSSLATRPGTIAGTVGYMSPEQIKGEAADFRSDVFSFGAVFYEMLTGKRAFHRDSDIATMNAILKDDVAPFSRHVPPWVAAILHRCLMKDPERRYQEASELAQDLARTRPSKRHRST